jgi:hypothetical protein
MRSVRDNLIRQAKKLVDSVQQESPLIGACIVSSLAAGDFTPASDVDMLMIAADSAVRPIIERRLVDGRVFEWMVLSHDSLGDVEAILADAGLCHDILTAIILLDEGYRLAQLQQQIAAQYQQSSWIWQRTFGQLQRVNNAINLFGKHLAEGNLLSAQRAHVSVIRGFCGISRAILNRRCTMARGLLFCREATTELGWLEYYQNLLAMLGAAEITREAVNNLQGIAAHIVAASSFSETERAIRLRFLESSHWLLGHAQPAEACWPLYFWSSTNVEESGREHNLAVWEQWRHFARVLEVDEETKLQQKKAQATQLYQQTIELVQSYKA